MSRNLTIDVMLVDDHEVVREGVKAALTSPYHVVADVGDAASALRVASQLRPDIAVIDMRLPDMTGPELCQLLRNAAPETHVVVLSSYFHDEAVQVAMRAGACHYVSKHSGLSALRQSLDEVTAGDRAHTDHHRVPQVREAPLREHATAARRLTDKEEQVLELAARGLTDREIGSTLFIAESTVRFHLQRMKTVLGAKSKTEAVAKAIRLGILSRALEA